MGAEAQQILRRGWWLLAIGLLTGLAVALSVGLVLGSTGADLVVTAVAGLLAGNAGEWSRPSSACAARRCAAPNCRLLPSQHCQVCPP
ncbi:hypothetical protein ACFQX8_18975 [Klenkia terrae]|uniref:hypothetical protein n=1 Tax=Klenkia terrae TaxID=1052259 RepID=UPI0036209CB5